jgi:ABC-type sugar transport system permease subunit
VTEPDTASATEEDPPKKGAQAVLEQMGGVSGLIYSSLPVLVFVPVSTNAGLMPAIYAALGTAALVLVWRLIRRESLQPAVSGFMGVGISALIAYLVGESKGYFLLGIWSSLVWAAVFALSVLIRRPVVGYIWGWVNNHDRGWRQVRRAVVAFDIATLTWVAVFSSRFVVQHHLYDADETGLLGVARIAMGWPLTGVAAVITYFAIRAAQKALRAQTAA